MWQEQLRSNLVDLDLHDLPCLPPPEKLPPAFSTLDTGTNFQTMPPSIVRSLSLPDSELHQNDPEEEDLTLEHAEELCHVSTYNLTTPELEGSVQCMDHSEKVSGKPSQTSNGTGHKGRSEGEQRRKNLRIAQDRVSKGFLSIPMDLQKL